MFLCVVPKSGAALLNSKVVAVSLDVVPNPDSTGQVSTICVVKQRSFWCLYNERIIL